MRCAIAVHHREIEGIGKACVAARETGVERDGTSKEVLRFGMVLPGEAVHMPKATLIALPGVEAFRRFAPCSFPFNTGEFGLDRRHGRFVSPPSQFATPSAGSAYSRSTNAGFVAVRALSRQTHRAARGLRGKSRLRRKEAQGEISLCGQ